MLTGRCKQDFELWIETNDHIPWLVFFEGLPETVKSAYIIEWFDSVGVYITIDCFHSEHILYFETVFKFYEEIISSNHKFKTRQEATKAAIEKANELYNYKCNKECSQ